MQVQYVFSRKPRAAIHVDPNAGGSLVYNCSRQQIESLLFQLWPFAGFMLRYRLSLEGDL